MKRQLLQRVASPVAVAAALYASCPHVVVLVSAWTSLPIICRDHHLQFSSSSLFANPPGGGGRGRGGGGAAGSESKKGKRSAASSSSSSSSVPPPPPPPPPLTPPPPPPPPPLRRRPRGQRPSLDKMMEIINTLGGAGASQRPGAIIETEEQLQRKEEILAEISSGVRQYPDWTADYGEDEADSVEYDSDDPTAVDAGTLGTWTIMDLKARFDYEYNPDAGQSDPNVPPPGNYITNVAVDDDGVEVGYDPRYGPSSTMDTRTLIGARDSYMIDPNTRDESMLTKEFQEGDLEVEFNEEVVQFRQSLNFIETYIDPFLGEDLPVPRHAATWYGYPEQIAYPPKDYSNNRFTDPENLTDFDAMTPSRARQRAVELARSNNAEWLPDGVSQAWHKKQRQPYDNVGTRVGTLQKGDCPPEIVEQIQPALNVLGSIVDLLSIEQETIFRFYYYGLIKNKHGMACWAETLIRDCGVDVTSVIFETGFRKRDPAYDGGDPWYPPSF